MVHFKYLRFFIFGLIVAVYSTPLGDLSARQGICESTLFRGRILDDQLAPVEIPLTEHLSRVTTFRVDEMDWEQDSRRPGHIFRWRARRGTVGIFFQIQVWGNVGATATIRAQHATSARTSTTWESNRNANGGGTERWGNTVCVSWIYPEEIDPDEIVITYSAIIRLGKIAVFLMLKF
jgi:hypothetical protein